MVHEFSDKIKFQSNIRVAETYNQYDAEVNQTPMKYVFLILELTAKK